LAKFLIDTRRWVEGGRLARESWQGRLRILGVKYHDTLDSQQAYAEALSSGGDFLSAERIQLQILQIRERVLGPDDLVTINALRNEGAMLESLGKHSEAEQYLRRALASFERTGLADQPDQFFCVKELAMCRLLQGDATEAEKLLQEVLPRSRQRLGPDDRVTLYVQRVLARALAEEGRLDEAESLCKETLDALRRTTANQESHSIARTLLYLGRVLVEQGKLEAAEPLLQETLPALIFGLGLLPFGRVAAQIDGASPYAGLVSSGQTPYGTASRGGSAGVGTDSAGTRRFNDFRLLPVNTMRPAATLLLEVTLIVHQPSAGAVQEYQRLAPDALGASRGSPDCRVAPVLSPTTVRRAPASGWRCSNASLAGGGWRRASRKKSACVAPLTAMVYSCPALTGNETSWACVANNFKCRRSRPVKTDTSSENHHGWLT
jgi:hypothetical protein